MRFMCWCLVLISVSANAIERSYWLHASLGLFTQKNYWGTNFPATSAPTQEEVRTAAKWLTGPGAANRLYLIYHKEISLDEAEQVFRWWRSACPESAALVPTFVLKMYDAPQTPVFTPEEIRRLSGSLSSGPNTFAAVYDVMPNRNQGPALPELARNFPSGLIRVGLQPEEKLEPPFVAAVQDTWSGFCHGKRNQEDWLQPGFGADTLKKWVEARNSSSAAIAWNLVVVAWDYSVTDRGAYPGYDDAEKNMPLPRGRTQLGAKLIRDTAKPPSFAGFSSDLYILHENSRSTAHDGREGSFYECLKRGKDYSGYYSAALKELIEVYRSLSR
jgi:hypothetical protein